MDEQERKEFSLEDIQKADDQTLMDHASEMWRIVKDAARTIGENNRAMLAQAAQIKSNLDAYVQSRNDQDRIAVYLRENYTAEIKQGKHKGMTFSDVIIMYLSREREANRSTIVTGRPGGGIQ